jgi:hypothetical protein
MKVLILGKAQLWASIVTPTAVRESLCLNVALFSRNNFGSCWSYLVVAIHQNAKGVVKYLLAIPRVSF